MRIVAINFDSFSFRILITCLILSLISISIYPAYAPPPPATLSVSPSTVTVSVGKNFSINITITDALDLYAWEFKLSWNATLLDATSVKEGPFLQAGGSTFFSYKVNATAGRMVVDCTLLGMIPGVNGNGVLATITFYVKNEGECPLDLYEATLLNSFENPIPYQAVDGYGYFTPPHDVAVTGVSASPLTTLPGNTVNINVTVQNQGGFNEVFNVTTYANSQVIGMQTASLDKGLSTTIPFTWNTNGFGKGDYKISAQASVVPEEAETEDNNKTADNNVTILYAGHDVAVVGIEPLKTVVGQGYIVSIAVTVKNYGIYSETFDTDLYINTTEIGTQQATLASGESTKLAFAWNTSSWVKGKYIAKAYAEQVLAETNTTDNYREYEWITVTIPGDINGDFKVDIKDLVLVTKHFGSYPSHPKWNPNADINSDGKVDIKDLVLLIKHFGEHYP